jgi:pimeloyl-ACP methyl ester carboxylesterase
MDIVLVPGLWLDGASWDEVTPHLEAAGHRVHPVTLPGLESRDADRSAITLDDHVAAVVALIDAAEGPVVLVGHSGGAGIVHAAADARPDRVARNIFIGGFPNAEGQPLVGGFEATGGEVPLPDFAGFEEAELRDLDEAALADFRARAIPSPAGVVQGLHHYTDDRRYDVPVTVIAPEFTGDDLREWMAAGHLAELSKVKDLTIADLPTGHWPQFSKPAELALVILSQPPLDA